MNNPPHKAVYTEGLVFGHVSNLAITSAIGIFAIMVVDLVDMFFISILGEPSLAAAVGFAGLGLFFGASICIGVSIAVSTLVAQALGAGDERLAQRYATHGFLYSLVWTIPITLLTWIFAKEILAAIGATGQTLSLAVDYFRIVGASLPILGLAFVANSLLRAVELQSCRCGPRSLAELSTLLSTPCLYLVQAWVKRRRNRVGDIAHQCRGTCLVQYH